MQLGFKRIQRSIVPSSSKVEQGSSKVESMLGFTTITRQCVPTTTKVVDMGKLETVRSPDKT